MANLPAGFLEALATKYAVLDRDSKARSGLEEAQTAQVAPNAASQRALQGAQTGQVQATTAQVAPLAASQIQTGQANSAEAAARSGLYGAQQQSTLHDLIDAPEESLRHFGSTVLNLPSIGQPNNVIGGSPTATAASGPATRVQKSILDTDTGDGGLGIHLNKGIASVPGKGKGMPGYAQGTSSVPGPGQTVSTGSWEGPVQSAPTPTSTLAQGAGIKRVPRLPLAKGTAKVPGKGDEDTVPAMLTPEEAVLNKGAAKIMGRGLIGVLNALGNNSASPKGAPATKGMP